MKIGIIGFGSIGNRHFKNLQFFGADIVVLTKRTDIDFVKCVPTWEDFTAEGPFAVIFVTNETAKHLETINKCLELNPKALFIEKPLSHSSAGLKELAEKIKQHSVSVLVGYNFHFFEPFIRIKEIIKSGKLGNIYYLRVSVGQDLSEWRPRDYHLSYSSQKEQGGGVMLDLVHDLNYPAWLLDTKLKVETCAIKQISNLGIDVEDWVESVLSTDSGVMISLHQDYVRVPYKRSLEISGSEASLSWDSDANKIIVLNRQKEVILSEEANVERNVMYENEIKFFMEAVEKNESFSNLEEAIHDVKLIEELKKYAGK